MKLIKNIGLSILLLSVIVFTSILFLGKFRLSKRTYDEIAKDEGFRSEYLKKNLQNEVIDKSFTNIFSFSHAIEANIEKANIYHKSKKEWNKILWGKTNSHTYKLAKKAGIGFVTENKVLLWWLTFGLGIIGGLLFVIPDYVLLGEPGIKNDKIFQHSATNRGWIAWVVFTYLVGFYLLLYFAPAYVVNWTYLLDPISGTLNGGMASQWFVYGFMYCIIMLVMGVRMYIKYRHNKYQIVRTTSVLFFQIVFAFLIPEIMTKFGKPGIDFKNAFPLDYDFFFEWNLKNLSQQGNFGIFILVWGIVLTLVIVPIMVYFFGKRWYCSWVCGCGGLAETMGDPYRQLSSKKIKAWQLERWLIHSVLVFSIIMTVVTIYCYFTGSDNFLGISSQWIKDTYSFLIGAWFAGVIGTGFYPIFGNRTWCRFGCPLAAYMGLIQRFKSRFRITTNGGQCISCGNCSTYCEQGIDVRAYAQKGENIVRASCVGCGVCSAVCPRGVLKLENAPEKGRINPREILMGNDIDLLDYIEK